MLNKVALRPVSLQVYQFSHVSVIPPVLHTRISFIYHRFYVILAIDSTAKRNTKCFLPLLCSIGGKSNFCLVYVVSVKFVVWVWGKICAVLNIHYRFFPNRYLISLTSTLPHLCLQIKIWSIRWFTIKFLIYPLPVKKLSFNMNWPVQESV